MIGPTEALLLLAVVTVSPGLDTMLTLRQTAARGQDAALWTIVGVAFGLLAQTAAAGAGLSLLVARSPTAFPVLKAVGAGYLLALGLRSLWAAWHPSEQAAAAAEGGSFHSAFALGFVTNTLNPKVVLFYLTFLPVAAPRGSFLEVSVLYGCAHAMMAMLWLGLLVFAAEPARRWLGLPAVRRGIDAAAGVAFVAFAALAWL